MRLAGFRVEWSATGYASNAWNGFASGGYRLDQISPTGADTLASLPAEKGFIAERTEE